MDNRQLLQQIFSSLVSIQADIQNIKVDISRNTADLENHIMRTAQNERLIQNLDQRLIPMEKFSYGWVGVGKTITLIASVAGIVLTIVKLLHGF